VVVCLERGADLHMSQLMPLPLTVSCFSKIQIGFAFLVPAHPGSPGKRAVKRVCVCVCACVRACVCVCKWTADQATDRLCLESSSFVSCFVWCPAWCDFVLVLFHKIIEYLCACNRLPSPCVCGFVLWIFMPTFTAPSNQSAKSTIPFHSCHFIPTFICPNVEIFIYNKLL